MSIPNEYHHQIDIILPDNRSFFLPLTSNMNGSDLINFLETLNFENYIVCRNSPTSFQYEVLYSCDPIRVPISHSIRQIYKKNKIEGFQNAPIQEFFYPNRMITTKTQRNTFFIFYVDDFISSNSLLSMKIPTISFAKTDPLFAIIVRMPTGFAFNFTIKSAQTILTICNFLHKKLVSLYTEEYVRPAEYYELKTIDGFVPDVHGKFNEFPELIRAYKNQRIKNTPQLVYDQISTPTHYNKMTTKYIKKLDLLAVNNNNETKMLNSTLSKIRKKIENQRMKKIKDDILSIRMNLSKTDPPLNELCKTHVLMKIKVQSIYIFNEENDKNELTISIKVDVHKTANQAIEMAVHKLKSIKYINGDYNPEILALTVPGTDDVICGPHPLNEFVHIRNFLISESSRFIPFILILRNKIEASIKSRELNFKNPIEPSDEELFKAIQVTNPPEPNFKIMPAYPHTHSHEYLSIFISCCVNIEDVTPNSQKSSPPPPPIPHPQNKTRRLSLNSEKMPSVSSIPLRSNTVNLYNNLNEEISKSSTRRLIILARLYNGNVAISDPVMTKPSIGSSSVVFNEVLKLNLQIYSIPRSARISLTLYDYDSFKSREKGKHKKCALATFNYAVFAFDGWLNSGHCCRRMWANRGADPILTTCESENPDSPQIFFNIQTYRFPISFCSFPVSKEKMVSSLKYDNQMQIRLEQIQKMDPLQTLSKEDKTLVFARRYDFASNPRMLSRVLSSIDYTSPAQVQELPTILSCWEKPKPTEVLLLLDADFADPLVREYAVNILEDFTDNEIMLYMLQLVQALKYEPYDESPLLKFLFRRGLAEPKFVGHQLFWQLISEAHISHIQKRFSSILMNFLYGIGSYCDELLTGYNFTKQLVALHKQFTSHGERLPAIEATKKLRAELTKISIPKEFHLPIDPKLMVQSFIVEKCKVMNSKKQPFFLAFENANPFSNEPVFTLFKVGDDLRQDQLTLQLLKVMNYLWLKSGLDFKMNCYGVLPTGKNQGFIEVVPNSITESELQQDAGTLTGVINNKIFFNFLLENNPDQNMFMESCKTFKMSSAGYAVSTCILGIADRHPGNIMVQKDGHYFHIDFGHFLGNFKTKYGYKREDAPFHFSPACQYVIQQIPKDESDPSYENESFEILCGVGLNVLRMNSDLLISLLLLMLGTGIPELRKASDINYMKDMLFLDLTYEQVVQKFSVLIKKSLESTKTKINNLFHTISTK